MKHINLAVVVAIASGTALVSADASAVCSRRLDDNNFKRPIDFNSPTDAPEIKLVNDGHFNDDVFALRKGTSSYTPEHDLDYALRHVPNHYGALDAMGRWRLKHPPSASRYQTADCYFERALLFRPEDPQLHFLYALYLQRAKQHSQARAEYAKAEELGGDDAELYYNRGLLEFDTGNRELARQYAEKAYARGYPLPGLRRKLEAADGPSKK